MKLFFLIVFVIYLIVNSYIFIKGWQILPSAVIWKITYVIFYFIIAGSFIVAMLGREVLPLGLLKVLYAIGTTWLACMLYFTLSFLLTDLINFFNRFLHFLPDYLTKHFVGIQVLACSVFVFIVLLIGNIRFNNPTIETYNLKINKSAGSRDELKIIGISDVHLGLSIDKKRLKKYVEKINSLKPDVILIAGDLIDNNVRLLNEEHLEEELNKLNATLGVYACLGNHEYITGLDESVNFFDKTKIHLLIDTSIFIDNSFWIIGRDDKSNSKRLSLNSLMKDINKEQPVFLIDHQPYHLDEAQENKIDFQLSGHTHNGQIWPGNLIVKKIYELGYGYKLKGDTNVYVSSGLGLWGPMFRIGSQSEIVVFNIKFE